ncbi:MAG: sulfite exporter TauE/SafE family protein [Microgenomates group bacterium]
MENALFLIVLAFIMEVIDSGLGMGYGTILSPLLIIFGFSSNLVVPSILISQAVGGFMAAFFHNKYKTADLFPSLVVGGEDGKKHLSISKDLRISLLVGFLGVGATVVGAVLGVKLPKEILKLYIGVLVTIIGVVLLLKRRFNFSWKKITGLAIISAFNKGISGGGFGPLMTGGQVLSGNHAKKSIGSTTLSEVPICITGFIIYLLSKKVISYDLLINLTIGAFFGGIVGPTLTKYLNVKLLQTLIAVLILSEGIWLLSQSLFHFSLG